MDDPQRREGFDTAIGKIKSEVKHRLVAHGFFGSVTRTDIEPGDSGSGKSALEIIVSGRVVRRTFERQEIEECRQRVSGAVLAGIISMVEELSTPPR